MKLSDAIEKVKHLKNFLMVYEDIHQVTLMTDSDKEAIDTVVSHLAHLNTANKTGLDDSLQQKAIEQPDNQEGLSNKKDMENFAEWMIGRSADWIADEERCETAETLIEMWEKKRGEK